MNTMELSLSHQRLYSFNPYTTSKQPLMKRGPSLNYPKNLSTRVGIKCGKSTNGKELLLVEEIEKEGKELREMENCKEGVKKGGVVELVECLEKEAIMGDDQGREPVDYNRRARIFDKSSKVFQALKELDSSKST